MSYTLGVREEEGLHIFLDVLVILWPTLLVVILKSIRRIHTQQTQMIILFFSKHTFNEYIFSWTNKRTQTCKYIIWSLAKPTQWLDLLFLCIADCSGWLLNNHLNDISTVWLLRWIYDIYIRHNIIVVCLFIWWFLYMLTNLKYVLN